MSLAKDSPVWDAVLTKARQEIGDEIVTKQSRRKVKQCSRFSKESLRARDGHS